jgi:hypothetical protein
MRKKKDRKREHLTEKDQIKCRKLRQDRSMRNKNWRNIQRGKISLLGARAEIKLSG